MTKFLLKPGEYAKLRKTVDHFMARRILANTHRVSEDDVQKALALPRKVVGNVSRWSDIVQKSTSGKSHLKPAAPQMEFNFPQ